MVSFKDDLQIKKCLRMIDYSKMVVNWSSSKAFAFNDDDFKDGAEPT